MNNKRSETILISALDNYGGYPFNELFDHVVAGYGAQDVAAVHEMGMPCTLILWGGEDISPSIYGQMPNVFTSAKEQLSRRDQLEVEMVNKAMELGIPIIGICRGAQLMCALSGGSLVQHVEGHAGGYHKIKTSDGRVLNCPSLHHQMMYPWPRNGRDGIGEFKYLAWMEEARSTVYFGEPEENSERAKKLSLQGHEPEVIWIPTTKSLCIQSHPEFIHDSRHEFVQYCLSLTKEYIFGQKSSSDLSH